MFTIQNILLLGTSTLCCILAFHRGAARRIGRLSILRSAEHKLYDTQRALLYAGACFAMLMGLFMRLYLFPTLPGGVNQDGAMAASDAMALAQYGTDRLGTPWPAHLEAWGKGQMSALLSYILAGSFKLFGISRLSMRLPQLLISLLSIPVAYDFARRTLGKHFGLIVLCLLLINPWHIMQSRWTIDCALFPHFFLFGAYCLLRGAERRAWFYPAMVFFALSMYTYGIALYTVPPFLLMVLIALLCQRMIRWPQALLCTALYLLISAPFLATMLLNYLGGKTFSLFGFTIQYFPKSIRSTEIVFMQSNWFAGLMRNTQYLANLLLRQNDEYMYMDLPAYGSNYLLAMPLIVIGIAVAFTDRIQKREPWFASVKARWGTLLTLMWLMVAAFSVLLTDEAHLGRAAILMYPTILCIAYAVYRIVKRKRLLAAILALCFAVGSVGFAREYFAPGVQHKLGRYYYAGLIEALEAARGRSFDTLYLTQTFPEENQYGMPEEVLIEFAQRLDARYAHGDKRITDPDGRVWLPFAERYQLADMSRKVFVLADQRSMPLDPKADALYVAYGPDKDQFDPADFTFETFGDYYLVTPKYPVRAAAPQAAANPIAASLLPNYCSVQP